MPKILQEQTLQSFLDIVQTHEVQLAQSQVERLTVTAESFSRAANVLPEQFRRERLATVQQVLDGFGAERTNLVNQLLSKEQQLEGLLGQLQATLGAGDRSATSIHSAADALAKLVDRFEKAKAQSRENRVPGSQPFDIREYGAAARDIGAGAEQLVQLTTSLERQSPQMERLLSQIQTRSNLWTSHLFNRALLCGSLIVLQIFLAAVAYRCISARVLRKQNLPRGS
jgi:chromosome segregation ATPase